MRSFALCSLCALLFGCGGDGSGNADGAGDAGPPKALPRGVFESAGPVRDPLQDTVSRTARIPGQDGVLVRLDWDLCGDDEECLFDSIAVNLDAAQAIGLTVALGISDGDGAPPAVKAQCATFEFTFAGSPRTMCLPWDPDYVAAKRAFVQRLGARFDAHPGLGYVYFTGACSTNGFEGHCRVDESAFVAAGYTESRLSDAYVSIMDAYVDAFPTTPIAFEAHALFDSATVWEAVWQSVASTGRVGVAAWWCSERLSVRGGDTLPVVPLLVAAAEQSFTVCQTVGNMTNDPSSFSDAVLGLDYGTAGATDASDSANAFADTTAWASGDAVHAGQSANFPEFDVLEAWTVDVENPAFAARLSTYPDP